MTENQNPYIDDDYIRQLESLASWRFDELYQSRPSKRILVLTSNYQQFVKWCVDHHIPKHSPSVKHVYKLEHLLGCDSSWNVVMPQDPGEMAQDVSLREMHDMWIQLKNHEIVWLDSGECDALKAYLVYRQQQEKELSRVIEMAKHIFRR